MPDCPANSPGENDRESDRETDPAAGLPRVRVMLPLPLPEPLDYLMPEGAAVPEPGSFVRVSLGPRRVIGVVWDRAGEESGGESGSAVPLERLKPVGEILPTPPLRPGAAPLCRARRPLYAEPAGRGAAHGDERRGGVAAAAAAPGLRRDPGGSRRARRTRQRQKADRGAPSGARSAARRCGLVDRRSGPAGGVRRRGGARPHCRRPCRRAAAAGRAAVAAGLRAHGMRRGRRCRPTRRRRRAAWSSAPAPAASASRCSTGSPDRARPRPISPRSRRRWLPAARCWSCCPRSRSGRSGSTVSAAALARCRSNGIPTCRRPRGARPGGRSPPAARASSSGRARRSSCRFPSSASLSSTRSTTPPTSRRTASVIRRATWRCCAPRSPRFRSSWCRRPRRSKPWSISRAAATSGCICRAAMPRRRSPQIALVDMRKERVEPGRFLSAPLVEALGRNLAAGEQSLLFLNRRGYAPLTLCRACGHRLQCPSCTAWLVEHRFTGRLLCHHCGYAARVPALCPECLTAGTLVPCGPGVERLREEVAARFPGARIALMVSDLLVGAARRGRTRRCDGRAAL